MGQNSTEVAYGFGQLGSVFTNLAKPVFPPKDHVIVAVQFLADNTPTVMLTETLDSQGPNFPGTDDTEATAANYLGVTEAAVANTTYTTVFLTDDTVELSAANTKIKVGQYVLNVNDADTIDAGLTVDTDTPTPVYSGPNKQGITVTKVNGEFISTSAAITPTASQTLVFLDEQHGAGGTTMESVVFPRGITIYGRWTTVTPSAAPVICYFGK